MRKRRRSSKYSSYRPVEDITDEDLDNIAITVKDKIYDKVLVSSCCFLYGTCCLLIVHLALAKRCAFWKFWRGQLSLLHKHNLKALPDFCGLAHAG